MEKTKEQIAMKVSLNTIIWNVILSIFKLFAGIFANSFGMISDSVHSMSDVISTIIVMIGVKISGKQADKNHPYGHERFECVAAIILSAILFATGIGIGWTGIEKIIQGAYEGIQIPGILALIAAIFSIIIKEGMYWYTRLYAKKINSSALMADAWHHRSDALSSIGSFIGILGARLGFPILDSITCVVICLFILKAAIDIFIDSINKMTDQSCDDITLDKIRSIILTQDFFLEIDLLKTRLFGDRIYVDVEISIDGNVTLHEAHAMAEKIHDDIESKLEKVKHCMVHVNPLSSRKSSEVKKKPL